MLNKDYDWKRFWRPRSGSLNLADGGYLYDPDTEWGKAHNPDLLTLEAIADIPCLVLLGEPGIGKSKVIEIRANEQDELVLDLHSYGSEDRLIKNLFESSQFRAWVESSHTLYLFLDSLDECLLRIDNVTEFLAEEFKQYQKKVDRLFLRIACRKAVWKSSFEEQLKQIWGKDKVKVYELAPLRWRDVRHAAECEGINDPDLFMKEILDKRVVPLAIKPITLGFLLNIYRHNGQILSTTDFANLYREGCRILCDEEEDKSDLLLPGRKGNLELDQRLIIAARIAAVTVFAKRDAVWTGRDRGQVPGDDVLSRELAQGYEKANARRFEASEASITEVLNTGLFSSRGTNRMGWAHQTYAEFLAAWYLTQHEIPLARITDLIFSSEDPDHKLIPQLHEAAAWLASMRPDVLQEIIKTDPDVLLQTDVPTDADVRASIVDNLLTQYEEGKLFDRNRSNYRNYTKLNYPGLTNQLRPYICDSSKQIDTRDLAIDIAEVCKRSELQEELADLALDSSQSINLRVSAAKAICSVGDATTRLKLKPLAIEQRPEDEDDQLKGYALQALWPDHLTAEELFQTLTSPKRLNFLGGYQLFLDYEMVPQLQPHDLAVALDWLASQGIRCLRHPFEQLGDAILLKAWENFDLPGASKNFTKVALVQWREHQSIITSDSELLEQFASSLLKDIGKRHALIEQVVLIIAGTEEDPYFILSSLTENILVSEDIFWMLKRLQNSNCKKAQNIWAQLIEWNFNRQDVKQIDAVTVATQTNDVLQEIFLTDFAPIELDSAQAAHLRANYLRRQGHRNLGQNSPLLDPPPKVRVLQLLEALEAGNLSAWCQLNMAMTLKPESKVYYNELDLTKLPGWQEADEAIRRRIIEGAKQYIQQKQDIAYTWIRTNTYNRPALADCRALLLLLQESIDFLNTLPAEIWKKWAPVLIAAPRRNQHEDSYLEIVKCAYLNAPEESLSTLMILIDKENCRHDHLFVIERFDRCWDKRLKLALLEKAKDSTLKPECVGQLLDKLLAKGLTEARDFAKSLISFPRPLAKNERDKALIAARVLVENSAPSSWSLIWPLIQQDSSFGREVLELAAYRYPHSIQLNLTEVQLADLYVWLVHEYPYDEDPDHSNEVMAYSVTVRDSIARLRDSVLSQLKERGTEQACAEIQRLIQELPDITWLGKTLIDAQANMRRKTWQPLSPEEFLQFVISQELSNLDLSNQIDVIDQRTKKMEDEPKIENKITISNSPNSPINAPVGNSGEINSQVNAPSSDSEKRTNWGNWLAVIGILVAIIAIPLSMSVSGAFNEEFKQWFNRIFPSKVEQQSAPRSK